MIPGPARVCVDVFDEPDDFDVDDFDVLEAGAAFPKKTGSSAKPGPARIFDTTGAEEAPAGLVHTAGDTGKSTSARPVGISIGAL